MQVNQGEFQIFGKGAVPGANAQRGALLAVRGSPGLARSADPAPYIDLAHHALSKPFRRSWHFYHLAHKLMPRDASEGVITFPQRQVGAANSRQAHAHQGLPNRQARHGNIRTN